MNKLPRMNVINKQAAVALEGCIPPDELDAVHGGQGSLPPFNLPAPMYGTPFLFDKDRIKDLLSNPPSFPKMPAVK